MRKIILLLASFVAAFAASSQSLDPSFAGKGFKSFDFLTGNFYYENTGQVLVKPDGSFFVLYTVNGFAVVSHYFANGNRDGSFGNGGYSQSVDVTEPKAALQSDGKIVIAGTVFDPVSRRSDFGITRLTSTGFLDKSFGDAGYQQINFYDDDDRPLAITLQSNGRILVAGQAYDPNTGFSDFAIARFNTNGTLDGSFDDDGKLTTDFSGFYDQIQAIAVLPSGKIVVAGDTYNPETGRSSMATARYNSNGTLDKSFSNDGKQTTGFAGTDGTANAVAVQTDGKIVLAGTVGEDFVSTTLAGLVRYNIDGSLDHSFSGDGKVTIDFGDTVNVATAIAIQPDGKIVIGGYAYSPKTDNDDFVLARFNTTGTLDKSFNKDGKVKTDFDKGHDEITSIVLLPDGKIFASGIVFNAKADNIDYAVALYGDDGKLEHKFGHKGFVTGYYESGDSRLDAVAVQPDGKMVVVGYAFTGKTLGDFAVARLNADGSFDKSFGENGLVTTDILEDYDEALAVAVQPDGKIVVAGAAFNETTFNDEFVLVRYLPDGSLDKKFAVKGKATFGSPNSDNVARKVELQADGKIVVAGSSWDHEAGTSEFTLLRYTPNGTLDKTFDKDGVVLTDFSGKDDFATSLIIQPDGRLLVAGYSFTDINSSFSLARYNQDGALDKTFDKDGKVNTTFNVEVAVPDIVLQSDGKIFLAGESFSLTTFTYGYALARYNKDGALDASFDGDGKKTFEGKDPYLTFVRTGLQSDGKIILLSALLDPTTGYTNFALTRLTTTGQLDKTFDGDGTLERHLVGFSNIPTDMVIEDDKAYVSGYASTPAQVSLVAVYQLGTSSRSKPLATNRQLQGNDVLEAAALSLAVKAQPNPSTQFFTLSLQTEDKAAVQLKVSDAAGRLVEVKNNASSNAAIQIGQSYHPGVYYVEVTQGSKKSVVTLVKQ